jgi:hypothetical protein
MPATKHNHNDGKALPFGRKMSEGECPRCDELRNGAPARSWAGAEAAERNARQEREFRAASLAAGKCVCGKPRHHAAICTYGEW